MKLLEMDLLEEVVGGNVVSIYFWGCKVDVEYGFGEDHMRATWDLLFCGGDVGEGFIVKIGLARRIID